MTKITPHLWFDTQAVEASRFYASVFPRSDAGTVTTIRDTPSGDCDIVSFTLAGQPFQAISAGPLFTFNPSVSFLVNCRTPEEVDALWEPLIEGGSALMDIGSYPFSPRYGWLQDRFGLSWQIMQTEAAEQAIVPMLLFVGDNAGKAEEAITFYTSVFDDARIGRVDRHGADDPPEVQGSVLFADFTLEGMRFAAMDSARSHAFAFNEAISFMIHCRDQAEIDRYWDRLTAVPEAEQCGWLKDRYGLSWQVVPRQMDEMMKTADDASLDRVTQAFLPMKKLDVAKLEEAYAGR